MPGRAVDPAVAMNTEGVVTRTMRDTAGLLDAIIDRRRGGPWPPPPLPGPLSAEVGRDPGRLRIGLCLKAFTGADVEDGCASAARGAATVLEDLGHDVDEDAPPTLLDGELVATSRTVLSANAAAMLDRWSATLGRELGEEDVEPLTWQVVQAGRAVTAPQLLETMERQQRLAREAARWWGREDGGHDLLLTPSTAEPGPPLGAYKQGYTPGRASAFSRVVNATGQPALSLPLGWPDDGLPRGVQLVAAHGREDVLVRVGAQLEAAVPWVHRRPPILQ